MAKLSTSKLAITFTRGVKIVTHEAGRSLRFLRKLDGEFQGNIADICAIDDGLVGVAKENYNQICNNKDGTLNTLLENHLHILHLVANESYLVSASISGMIHVRENRGAYALICSFD